MQDSLERLRSALTGRYEVERELGRGGMAQVFLAQEQYPSRQVAIKLLDPGLAAVLGSARFLREVDLASKLTHPHILPIFTAGEADGMLYYVMPYVAGESLRERLNHEKQLPVADAVRLAREVAGALAYAHDQGVVHRDIKPENILLASDHAVVADFGIARAITAAGGDRYRGFWEQSFERLDEYLATATGVAIGTPAYMSPEQATGASDLDGRTDVYSLGCVLYEMLAGAPPFTGPTPESVVRQHLAVEPRDLTALRPAVPPVLARTVTRALAKVPADRFADAAQLAAALDEAITMPTPAVAPKRRAVRMRYGLVVLIVLGLIVAGFVVLRPREAVALDPAAVAVFPFRISGAGSLAYLREGMVDLLAAKLTGEGGPRAVDPRTVISAWRRAGGSESEDPSQEASLSAATSMGAGRVLLGSVVETSERLLIQASLLSAPDGGSEARAQVRGPIDSLPGLVDQLVSQLLVGQAGQGVRLAALTSTSLPALRTYLDGQAAYRGGQYTTAEQHFVRTLELDSSFSLAGIGLVAARFWTRGGFDEEGMAAAWAHRDKLSRRDSALLIGIVGPAYPAPLATGRETIGGMERAVELSPDRPEVWYWLGEALYHLGPSVGLVPWQERAGDAFRRATVLDPTFVAPLEHVFDLAAARGDTAATRNAADRYLAIEPNGDLSDFVRWRAALALGDSTALRRLRARFDSLSTPTLRAMTGTAVFEGEGIEDAERAAHILEARADPRADRFTSLVRAREFWLNLGQPSKALRTVSLIREVEPSPGFYRTPLILDALFGGGDTAAVAQAVRELAPAVEAALRAPRDQLPAQGQMLCAVMLWRVAAGVTASGRQAVDRLGELARTPGRENLIPKRIAHLCQAMLAASLAALEGGPEAAPALERLDSLTAVGSSAPLAVAAAANFTAAHLLEAVGNLEGALAAVRRHVHFQGTYHSTRLAEEGRLAEKLGRRDDAIRAYQHYLDLRRSPEPSVRPEVDRVRSALAQLLGESQPSTQPPH